MGLIVKHSDGSDFINIPDKTYDDQSTSLKLPGKGVLNWGETYVNNFVHLLENFAASHEPRSPQVGQLWYNTGTGKLYVYSVGHTWEVLNEDKEIEDKLTLFIEEVRKNNAGITPPEKVEKGVTWFDENEDVLKVYDGKRWVSFGINTNASYIEPENPQESDIWFDKNIKNLKVYDGKQFQRIFSTIESTTQPSNPSVGQFWTNQTNGKIYVYTQNETGSYEWKELGANEVIEGDIPPKKAKVGTLFLKRTDVGNILYINKGTYSDPVWVEIPEFSGAFVSDNEPLRVVDGMFWLDSKGVLRIRKKDRWVEIDETAISYVSENVPEDAKEGKLWFDTKTGSLKIKINNEWIPVETTGLINYGNAPKNPVVGQLWFDDVEGKLKIYDGSDWKVVNKASTIVDYVAPKEAKTGEFWLDTNDYELKVLKNGRWASIPEKARAYLSVPENPKNGDLVYVNDKLQIFDNGEWKTINVTIKSETIGSEVDIEYDSVTNELIVNENGNITRIPLGIKRDVIVENVGITSDVYEVIKPDIKEGERRIIDIKKIDLKRSFFVFKNGVFTDNIKVDRNDLIINNAKGEDEVDVIQLNGDLTINYLIKKFKSNVDGSFTIDNYTLTMEEQEIYDQIQAKYDAKLKELLANHGDNATENDLTDEEKAELEAIKAEFPVKESNNIADLSMGSVLVFKEGVLVPSDNLTINQNNENKIVIPNTRKGEVFTIIQMIAGTDYKSAFFKKEYSFIIGQKPDTTESLLNVKGKMMTDLLHMASKNTADWGKVKVDYTFDSNQKKVVFDLVDINPNFAFFVFRNNLYVSPTHYEVDKENKKIVMYANEQDEIRFLQFYLPHKYVPVEFTYAEKLVDADVDWVTMELNRDFNLDYPILVFRNGILQEKENINIITEEEVTDENGNTYTVKGLRKVQVFGDSDTNKESTQGIKKDDIVTIMQVSQPDVYNIYFEEFDAVSDGANVFTPKFIEADKNFFVYRNGLKLEKSEYEVNEDGKLIVKNCNGPYASDLENNPNAKGDKIVVYQFLPKEENKENELTMTEEVVVATQNGAENFQLKKTEFVVEEFLMVYKNGMLITRRQPENENTKVSQINTYKVFIDRIYHNKTLALDPTGNPIYDENGNPVYNVDPDDYTDVKVFNLDNVVEGEEIYIYEFNKKVTNVNNLRSSIHHEILPVNNIQRIYTTKFDQLSDLTMVFQDGLLIDRLLDNSGEDTYRDNGMLRIVGEYAVDNISKSIIVNDWKVGGKLRVHQFTAKNKQMQTKKLTVNIVNDDTYDVFLPNNETYTPNAGAIEVYVGREIQWSGEDYIEVANNRILFKKPLKKGQKVHMIIRK